jgi:HK97 family phage major capsid protein
LSRQIYAGGDTSAEIKGIQSVYAKAFAATDVVTTPEYWDVLLAAYKQSRKAYKGCKPNAILVSIGTGVTMDWQKSTATGMYLFPAFMTNQDKTLKGIPIIESDDVTDGDFLVGDFTKYLFNFTQPITIEIGWMNDDFGINQFRLRAELEGMGRCKAQFKDGFVKGTFSTAITDLTS